MKIKLGKEEFEFTLEESKVILSKQFNSKDMLDFATQVYDSIADLPGHEPTIETLGEWFRNKAKQ